MSKFHATLLGHVNSGMGEKSLAIKMHSLLEKSGYLVEPTVDIVDLLGDNYEPWAKLNYDLADNGHEILDDLPIKFPSFSGEIFLILSWCWSVAALFASGLHKKRPTIAKLYAHHPNERILTKLYEPADLLITESLLASERAMTYGISPEKILYLPHPISTEPVEVSRKYVEALARKQKKTVGPRTTIIGTVSRFEYGKNCEFALEAVRNLVERGKDVLLVLKGDFSDESPYPEFRSRFTEMLEAYQHEPWLLWDPSPTPFPAVLHEYTSFDLLLHPSGAEGGSHVVTECLGLGIPVVLLNCTTNPYLFGDLATFVKTTGELKPGLLPFYVPDLDDLVAKLENPRIPDRTLVEERFHPDVIQTRLPHLFERDPAKIASLYAQDLKHYGSIFS